jgi:hypothetical protein
MAAGALLELNPNVANAVDEAIATARHAFVAGVRQLWVPQFYDFDAISLAGIIGAAVPGLGVGTPPCGSTRGTHSHSLTPLRPRKRRRMATSASASAWVLTQ